LKASQRLPTSRLSHLLAFAVGISAIPCGCGGGGGSGSGSNGGFQANGAVSDVDVVYDGSYRFTVTFDLSASSAQELGIDVEFSEDHGLSFAAATTHAAGAGSAAAAGASPTFTATPSGQPCSLVWAADSDLASLQQHDLVLRITPYSPSSGGRGASATSDVFGLGGNTAPAVAAISTPAAAVGGWVEFRITLSDAESDFVDVEAQYSLNGGSAFATATLGDGAAALVAAPGGTEHTIRWHAQADVPESFSSNAVFRIRAADTEAGAFLPGGRFTVNTHAPSIDLLTADQIPAEMNGSESYLSSSGQMKEFQLLLPESGFVLWLEFSRHANGAALAPDGVELSSAGPVGGGAAQGGFDAGEDFGALVAVDAPALLGELAIVPELRFEAGDHTVTARARDVLGNVSESRSFTFRSKKASAATRPFESTDRWHLDFTRDNFTITSNTAPTGTVTITSTMQANGIDDFVEDLRIIGLNSAAPPQAAVDAGLNAVARDLIVGAVLGQLNTFFGREYDGSSTPDAANVQFFASPPSGTISRIAIGGDDPIPGYTIGRAEFDYRNAWSNDNTDADLGVFTNNLIDFYINSSFTFKSRFDALVPGRGTPLGFHAADVAVLAPEFDRYSGQNSSAENARYDEIFSAIDAFSRAVATILAHEIGHSIGLVANGAPSAGLFGGEHNASFAGPYTTSFHLDTAGNNIMAAAISFSGAVQTGAGAPAFNAMNMAYLRERLILE
jgi:hypothetical protein